LRKEPGSPSHREHTRTSDKCSRDGKARPPTLPSRVHLHSRACSSDYGRVKWASKRCISGMNYTWQVQAFVLAISLQRRDRILTRGLFRQGSRHEMGSGARWRVGLSPSRREAVSDSKCCAHGYGFDLDAVVLCDSAKEHAVSLQGGSGSWNRQICP
jgi:hypothetical protein